MHSNLGPGSGGIGKFGSFLVILGVLAIVINLQTVAPVWIYIVSFCAFT